MSLGAYTRVDVTRTHLELRSPDALRHAPAPVVPGTLRRLPEIRAEEYRALYTLVGERWLWRDRLVWSDDELDAYLSAPNVHIWLLTVAGTTAGYFELKQH